MKMLWVVVALAGVIMALLALMIPIGNVHAASRTNKRLSDLDNAPSGFTPSVAQYRDGCTDAKYLWDAMGTMMTIGFVGGSAVALLSLVGFGFTRSIQKRQINAQAGGADGSPAAGEPSAHP